MKNKLVKGGAITAAALLVSTFLGMGTAHAAQPVLDTSEWQGTVTAAQAKLLKGEVKGVILRVQYGSNYKDRVFDHNAATLKAAGVPFGVYAFGQYVSAADAKQEAKDFYARAKKYDPKFYVNDAEQQTTYAGQSFSTATKAFATEMQSLTSKKIYLYSYQYFYSSYIKSQSGYDGMWLAAYQTPQPTAPFSYQLWQYTDKRYSTALKKATDASKFIGSANWFGESTSKASYSVGGFVKGEVVRLKSGLTFYGTKTKLDPALAKKNLTVKATQTVYTGNSNQVLTIYNGAIVIGQVRAQDVAASYYHASYVKKVKVITTKGIYTYLHGKRQHFYKKGAVLKVSGYKTVGGYLRFVHDGHKTDLTTNKDFVKWVK